MFGGDEDEGDMILHQMRGNTRFALMMYIFREKDRQERKPERTFCGDMGTDERTRAQQQVQQQVGPVQFQTCLRSKPLVPQASLSR